MFWRALSRSNGSRNPSTVLLAIHRARSRTEANCRCEVSFERPSQVELPGHTHRQKENSDGKSLKSSALLAVVMKPETPEAWKGKTNYRQILSRQFWRDWTIFIEFMELSSTGTVGFRLASLPIFLNVSTTQNLKRSIKWPPNGSRSKETLKNKTKTQGESFLFLFLSKNGI